MIRGLLLFIGLALAGAAQAQAQAQIKCWTGADGKRACGDLPPPGAKLKTLRGAPAPPPRAATDVKQETPASTPQGESQKTANMAMKKAPVTGNVQECERAKEILREMGGGGRSKRTDAVKARALYANNCPS